MHAHNDRLEGIDDEQITDMMGTPCPECNKGLFEETMVTDERNGVLHCDKCNFEVFRYCLPEELEKLGTDNNNDNDFDGDIMNDNQTYDNYTDHSTSHQELDDDFLQNFLSKKVVKRCTDSHPPLPIEIDGNEFQIYGSSCSRPIVDADLYISLDYAAPVYAWEQPWYTNPNNQQHIRFFIEDMDIPDEPEDFHDLVDFAIEAMSQGKIVHAGCIAGHGRTGLLLAAVAQKAMGDKLKEEGISAIDYVRDNYCEKAVETLAQVLFLNAEFNIEIPRKQVALVKEFKEMFDKEISYPYDKLVAHGEFMALKPIIEKIDAEIYRKYNPPKPKAPLLTRAAFANPIAGAGLSPQITQPGSSVNTMRKKI